MRGSLKTQITAALKCCCRFGVSRHAQKLENGGKSPFIHSIGAFDKIAHRLWPLAYWLKEQGFTDLEKLNVDTLALYLQNRLAHHLKAANARKTYQCELSALANLEHGLSMFSEMHRKEPLAYDFSALRKQHGKLAKQLMKKTNPYSSRAIPKPYAVAEAVENPAHRLMVKLQIATGCRAIGVGAPARSFPGSNALLIKNFLFGDDTAPRLMRDKITDQPGYLMWVKEKGGKLAVKFCPKDLAHQVFEWLKTHPEGLSAEYSAYLSSVNAALVKTGQAAKGRGTHSLRFCFAQKRYMHCLLSGLGDEEAKLFVSEEMSHQRPKITETYLR